MASQGAFCTRLPVRFSDVDHAGILYGPVVFDYFHITLEEFFSARFGSRSYARLLDEEGIGLPVVSSRCDYLAPLRFGDTVEVEMTVERIGRASVTFGFRAFRCADDEHPERQLVAQGADVRATIDMKAFRAVAIPERLRGAFRDLQS